MNRPLRILVAEDDPMDVALLKRAFAKSQYRPTVFFVRDGQEVMDFLERTARFKHRAAESLPTLLLLDLKMPRVDGFEVLEWLRGQPHLRQILVVVFSSSEDARDMQRAYDLGADSYLVKPSDPTEFVDALHDMEQHWLRLNATPECGELLEMTVSGQAGA